MQHVEVSLTGKINGKLAVLFDSGIAQSIDSQMLAKVASVLNCEISRDASTGLLQMKKKFIAPKVVMIGEIRKQRSTIRSYRMPNHDGPGAA